MPHRVYNVIENIDDKTDSMNKEIDSVYATDMNEDNPFTFPDIHIPSEKELGTSAICKPVFNSTEELVVQDEAPATQIKKVGSLISLFFLKSLSVSQ